MAKDNRVCIPKDLIDPVKAEAEKLLLTDDLTSAVTWILRAYFRDKNSLCCQHKQQPPLTDQSQADSLSNFEDLFVA